MDELEQQLEETKLQLEEAKLQLSDKLGTLEQQVSQTVETATTAVAATVEAVQGTVESVTGVVEEAVHGVHDAFDLRYQMEKHPFLVLGGAAVAGFLAAQYFKQPARKNVIPTPPLDFANGNQFAGNTNRPYAYSAAPQTPAASAPSAFDGLKAMAVNTVMSALQGVAMRAIPEVVGMVVGGMAAQQVQPHHESTAQHAPREKLWPEEDQPFSSSTSSEHQRSSKLS